jgi:hypothetical protein
LKIHDFPDLYVRLNEAIFDGEGWNRAGGSIENRKHQENHSQSCAAAIMGGCILFPDLDPDPYFDGQPKGAG